MENYSGSIRLLSFSGAQKETMFGKEFLNIGPTPYNEECTQVGEDTRDNILECLVYIKQLVRYYGDPPSGCEFFVIRNEHDAGIYYDVNIFYCISNEEEGNEGQDYALNVEFGIDNWDEISLKELRDSNHPLHVGKVIPMKKTA